MTETSTPKKATTSKGLAKFASNEPRGSVHTALRGISHSARAKTIERVTDNRDELHRLYLRRKSQRNVALKNVIKHYQKLEHAEWFLGTLKAWHSGTDGHFALDDFLDHVADTNKADESNLDVAVGRLAVTHKRLHDVIDAMNDRVLYARRPNAPVKDPNGNYDSEQVRNIVLKVVMKPNLGRQAARVVLDQVGDGVKSVTSLKPKNFDKVYEACQRLLAGKGASAEAVKPHVKRTVEKVVHLNDARRARKRHNSPRKL
jgi:hypothetical protein